MAKRIDITGQKFGRWNVLNYSHSDEKGQALWHCKCECGTEKPVRSGDLRSGKSVSCGCYNTEVCTTHNLGGTKLYGVWVNMRSRCQKENNPQYSNYGGRGIKVDENWDRFENFYEDMGKGYKEGLTLDRIDVNGNYTKDNCRWVSQQVQANNKRDTKYYTVKGITDTFANLCRRFNVDYELARGRLRHDWDIEEIFSKPSQRKRI